MNNIFEISGIIAWILCFSYEVIFLLKNNKGTFFKDFKNKLLQVIRIDKLLLIAIFIIYVRFNKDFVTSLVFTVICLYLYINKLYEKSKKEKLSEVFRKNWLTIIIVLIIAIIPFIYLIITNNNDNTYIALLLYIFFSYFIIGIANKISKFLKK